MDQNRDEAFFVKLQKLEKLKTSIETINRRVQHLIDLTLCGQVDELEKANPANVIEMARKKYERPPQILGVLRSAVLSSPCSPVNYKRMLDIYEKAKFKLWHAWTFPLIFNNAASFTNAMLFLERLPKFNNIHLDHFEPHQLAATYRLSKHNPVPVAWADIILAGHLSWYITRSRVGLVKLLLCARRFCPASPIHEDVFPKDMIAVIFKLCHLFVVAGEW